MNNEAMIPLANPVAPKPVENIEVEVQAYKQGKNYQKKLKKIAGLEAKKARDTNATHEKAYERKIQAIKNTMRK